MPNPLFFQPLLRTVLSIALGMSVLGACQRPNPMLFSPTGSVFKAEANPSWYARLDPALQSYYAPVKDLQGLALFEGLSQVVNQAQSLGYGDATTFLYTTADSRQVGKVSQIHAAYSNLWITGDGPSGHKYKEEGDPNKDGKNGDSINCEHTWPQGFFDKQEPMRSDMHHLVPTLITPNTRRSHYPLDNPPADGQLSYATGSGSHLFKTRQSASGYVFEPGNDHKGNSARALLYFYLRYHRQNIRQNDYRPDFFMPRLNAYRQWMLQDGVDAFEASRHEKIAAKQGNRNPFVDIPELMDLIGVATLTQVENR